MQSFSWSGGYTLSTWYFQFWDLFGKNFFNLGGGGWCLDLSRNLLGVKTSKQFWCSSSALQYRARMRSGSSRIPDVEKLNSDGTINKQPQTFNFLCFFLVILFNPLWGFLRLENSAREVLGVNFWSRNFISALISVPFRSHPRHLNYGVSSPIPHPCLWWAIILWCGYSITFQPSTSFGGNPKKVFLFSSKSSWQCSSVFSYV